MIPDEGSLKDTPPVKLLLSMYEQHQTGILHVKQNEILKVFYLNQGKISWAISSADEDKIERILLAKKLLSPEAIAPYQANNKISETFGKILVENGLLTLEDLINATREQLKRIAVSILYWSNGNYQLLQESPPTRLVSLELDIFPLIHNYILTQMDINIVWEELGSLSGELQQTSNSGKKALYALDAEQQEVFDCFREPQRLEAVLLNFSTERKSTILKNLYFLLISSLLIKKEAEALPSLDFNELDSLFGHHLSMPLPETGSEAPIKINPAESQSISLEEIPSVSPAEAAAAESLPELPEMSPIKGIPEDADADISLFSEPEKNRKRIQPLLKPEKPKSRWLSISFLFILLVATVIGLFLWLNRAPENLEPEPAATRGRAVKLQQRGSLQTKATAPAEQKPAPTTTAGQTVEPTASQLPATAGTMKNKTAAPQKEPTKIVSGPKTRTAGTPASETEIIPTHTLISPTVNARQAFLAEDFETAGKLWRQEMLTAKITHSILLEMDCLKQSVQLAYQQISNKDSFFILNRYKDGRSCWLVLWGKFRTQNEATQNLRLIPEYFFKQSEPPIVIELNQYL